jgi:hypothetical protein
MKKLLTGILMAVGAIGLVGLATQAVDARGTHNFSEDNTFHYENMLEAKAEALGLTVDELKVKLETMTLREIADEQGYDSEQFHEAKRVQMLERWQELGLTEEEIAERQERMENRQKDCAEGQSHKPFEKGRFRHLR